MPQTTDALRALMEKWFGADYEDFGATKFLKSHGYTQVDGIIVRPTPAHNVSMDEWYCIRYLIEEWDFDFQKSEIVMVE
jgi:hypothetical protein